MTSFRQTALLCGLVASVVMGGCRQNTPVAEEAGGVEERTAIEADAAPVEKAAVKADVAPDVTPDVASDVTPDVAIAANNSAQSSLMQITDSGVGNLTNNTPFSVEAIQAAFPTMEITTETAMGEGTEYPIIVVSDAGNEAVRIEPTADASRIYRVRSTSAQLLGASGHTVGDSFSSVYDGIIPRDCLPGVDASAGAVSCPAPGSQDVRYMFEGSWGPLMGQLPSDSELSGSTLKMIFWNTKNY